MVVKLVVKSQLFSKKQRYNAGFERSWFLTVKKEIYYKAKFILESILNHSQDYKYNLMGLILCKLEVPYRRNHYYFCSEFVSEILAYSQAIELPKLPCLMKPSDYLLFEELECL